MGQAGAWSAETSLWNDAAQTIFGYSAEEIIGRPFQVLLAHPEDLLLAATSGAPLMHAPRTLDVLRGKRFNRLAHKRNDVIGVFLKTLRRN